MEYQRNSDSMEKLKEHCQKLIQELEMYESHSDRICLKAIQTAITNKETDDFEAIDEIIDIMNEYGWSTGTRHDFG